MTARVITLAEAVRRYRNAQRRALYWSGTPAWRIAARSQECRSHVLDEKYGLAMCDCKSWENVIERITGRPVKHYDPKSRSLSKWS